MKLLAFVVVRIFPCLGLRELSKNHRCVIPGSELEGEFGGEKFSFLFYSIIIVVVVLVFLLDKSVHIRFH